MWNAGAIWTSRFLWQYNIKMYFMGKDLEGVDEFMWLKVSYCLRDERKCLAVPTYQLISLLNSLIHVGKV